MKFSGAFSVFAWNNIRIFSVQILKEIISAHFQSTFRCFSHQNENDTQVGLYADSVLNRDGDIATLAAAEVLARLYSIHSSVSELHIERSLITTRAGSIWFFSEPTRHRISIRRGPECRRLKSANCKKVKYSIHVQCMKLWPNVSSAGWIATVTASVVVCSKPIMKFMSSKNVQLERLLWIFWILN